MKLSDSIDLLNRRFSFYLQEDPIAIVYVQLTGDDVHYTFKLDKDIKRVDNVNLSVKYKRVIEDLSNCSVTVVEYGHKIKTPDTFIIWRKDGDHNGPYR